MPRFYWHDTGILRLPDLSQSDLYREYVPVKSLSSLRERRITTVVGMYHLDEEEDVR